MTCARSVVLQSSPTPTLISGVAPELEPKEFAVEWIEVWNSHNLEAMLSHYDDDVVLTSSMEATILNLPSGTVEGKVALRDYFKRGLEVYANLSFELVDVMRGLCSIVICYRNQKSTRAAEFMELTANEKIIRVVAHCST